MKRRKDLKRPATMMRLHNLTSSTEAFRNEVERCREVFLKELESLPDPLNKVAIRHYLTRIKVAEDRPVLGEYAPWLIADLAGISNHEFVEELMTPWLNVYTYITITDTAIDKQAMEDRKLLLIAAGLLLERGLTGLVNLSRGNNELLDQIDSCFTETAIAAVSELCKHRYILKQYTDEEIAKLGHKMAVIKLCARYTLAAKGATGIGSLDLKGIDSFCSGMQLLDDITDWEEDWKESNYTLPLTLTFQRLFIDGIRRAQDPESLNPEELLAGLIITESLSDVVLKSVRFLQQALSYVDGMRRDSIGQQFLEALIDRCAWFSNQVQHARGVLMEERLGCSDPDWLRQLTNTKRGQEQIRRIVGVFPVVAQES